jgi:hypothetical protein
MLTSDRLQKALLRDAFDVRCRSIKAAALVSVSLMLPCAIGTASAADISVLGKGYVATDSSVICTFWTGLGTETPFSLTDDFGNPVPWQDWAGYVSNRKIDDFLDGMDGLLWLSTQEGKDWFNSVDGIRWRDSTDGREWIDRFVKGAPDDRTGVEYVKICSLYGTGFYYIPGTDTCLKLGGYIRSDDARTLTDYDTLRNYFYRASVDKKPDTPAGSTTEDPLKAIAEMLDKNAQQPAQHSDQKQDAQTPSGVTTTSPTVTPAEDKQPQGEVKISIFVKGKVPSGVVPPPIKDEMVKLVGGGLEPSDLPGSGARTAEQENAGSDQGAPQGKTGEDGKVEFKVSKSELQYYGLSGSLRNDWNIKADYTFRGSLELQYYGGYVTEAKDNEQLPKNSNGSLESLSYRWGEFTVGDQRYWRVGYGQDANVKYTDQEIKDDIVKTLQHELGNDVRVTFENDICRVELPGPWTPSYTPIPHKAGEGLPTASIKLHTTSRRSGGAL